MNKPFCKKHLQKTDRNDFKKQKRVSSTEVEISKNNMRKRKSLTLRMAFKSALCSFGEEI